MTTKEFSTLDRPRSGGRHYILYLIRRQLQVFITRYLAARDDLVLVDYGCGDRPYQVLFKDCVAQYTGADLPMNAQADVHLDERGALPLADGSADVVLSTQVLEHVLKPEFYLAEVNRVLKPGGMLLLSTHGYWMFHPHPTDFWRWTSQGLRHIVTEQGFVIEDFEGLMGLAPTGLHLFQDGLTRSQRFPAWLKPGFYWVMQWVIQLLDWMSSAKNTRQDAAVYMLVARKPDVAV